MLKNWLCGSFEEREASCQINYEGVCSEFQIVGQEERIWEGRKDGGVLLSLRKGSNYRF